MKESLYIILWNGFSKAWGVPVGIIGLIAAITLWIYPATETLSLKIVVPSTVIFLILIYTFLSAITDLYKKYQQNPLPKLLTCQKDLTQNTIVLLLSPSQLFSFDSIVSVYSIQEQDYEAIVAIGVVINIQEDKKVQVLITDVIPGKDEIIKKLTENNVNTIEKIIVKPNIAKAYINNINIR